MKIRAFLTGAIALSAMFFYVKKPVNNPVVYFEIPVKDMSRAMKFYKSVFGFDFEVQTIDGNLMALFPVDPNLPGVTGALAKGDSYKPSLNGSRLYFHTSEIDLTMSKVSQAGGKLVYPVTDVGEFGKVAEFQDSEGNRIALSNPPIN